MNDIRVPLSLITMAVVLSAMGQNGSDEFFMFIGLGMVVGLVWAWIVALTNK